MGVGEFHLAFQHHRDRACRGAWCCVCLCLCCVLVLACDALLLCISCVCSCKCVQWSVMWCSVFSFGCRRWWRGGGVSSFLVSGSMVKAMSGYSLAVFWVTVPVGSAYWYLGRLFAIGRVVSKSSRSGLLESKRLP